IAGCPSWSSIGPALETVVAGVRRSGRPWAVVTCVRADSWAPTGAWAESQAASVPMACTAQSPVGRLPPGARAETTLSCGSTITCRDGPVLGAGGRVVPNCGVNSTRSLGPLQTVFCRGRVVGVNPATPQSSAKPGWRLMPRRGTDQRPAQSDAREDRFKTLVWLWAPKTTAARSPLASDSTTPCCTERPVSTPPTLLTMGASMVKNPALVEATELRVADACSAVVRLSMAGP